MYRITKTFRFSASHRLDHLPPEHKCHRLHGHNYAVTAELMADRLDGDGFVVDYGELAHFKDYLDEVLDHRHLNDVLGGAVRTTAENLARHLFAMLAYWDYPVTAVQVKETDDTSAEYRP